MKKKISFSFVKLTFFCSFLAFFTLNLFTQYYLFTAIHIMLLWLSWYILCTPFFGGSIPLQAIPIPRTYGTYLHELLAWILSLALNITSIATESTAYEYTPLSHLLYIILTTPLYWLILVSNFVPLVFSYLHYEKNVLNKNNFLYYLLQTSWAITALYVTYTVTRQELVYIFNIHS